MNDSRREIKNPVLMTHLLQLIGQCAHLYRQERVFNRVLALVMSELFAFGRHTVTQLMLTLGLADADWSAWYRLFSQARFDEAETAAIMAREMIAEVPVAEPFVVGVDSFHVARCSRRMPGTGWMRGLQTAAYKAGIQRGQRFVEAAWLTPIVNGYSRAMPMRCLSAFTVKAVPSRETPRTEVQAGLTCLQWIRQQLDGAGRQGQRLLTVADGNYDTLAFWSALPERTIGLVRSARNRCLYTLPAADAHGNRKYGPQAPAPHVWLRKRRHFRYQEVLVRGRPRRMRYRLLGPFLRDGLPDIPLLLLVIGGGKRPPGSRRVSYQPCFFLISAVRQEGQWSLPLPIADLLAWLWQRWELEVAHRQMKSGLGLGEKQCWQAQATVATVQWSVWVYTLMMLSGYRAWGPTGGRQPPGRWRSRPARWSFTTLWRAFRAEMWQQPKFRASWTGTRGNWLETEALWAALFNSVLASSRL